MAALRREHFFLLAAAVPALFGLVMMVAPQMMLDNSLAVEADATTRAVTQWVGFGVFTLGVVNFLARKDPGSIALRAIMVGNIVFHVLGIGFDIYGYTTSIMSAAGLVFGIMPHSLLALGFGFYLAAQRRTQAAHTSAGSMTS